MKQPIKYIGIMIVTIIIVIIIVLSLLYLQKMQSKVEIDYQIDIVPANNTSFRILLPIVIDVDGNIIEENKNIQITTGEGTVKITTVDNETYLEINSNNSLHLSLHEIIYKNEKGYRGLLILMGINNPILYNGIYPMRIYLDSINNVSIDIKFESSNSGGQKDTITVQDKVAVGWQIVEGHWGRMSP